MPTLLLQLVAVLVALWLAPAPAAAAPEPQPALAGLAFDDPGRSGVAGGWREEQWALSGPHGVDAGPAWERLLLAGRPGGRGAVVAVVDSGVAYRDAPPHRRSPDFAPWQFVGGFDALRGARPLDPSGHGTHVAAGVAARADNGAGLVGLAYGARIMPVRVLDAQGRGRPGDIARGIRHAVRHGADVLVLAFAFPVATPPAQVPEVVAALREAERRDVVVVAAAGNEGARRIALPARHPTVLAVGATTSGGCLAATSNHGARLDLVAPGGGEAAGRCADGRDIAQLGFRRPGRFRVLERDGTSHAAPLVAAAAALVRTSGVLGPDPSARAVRRRLLATARDLGRPGRDARYGAGMLDAGAAVQAP